MNTSKLVLIISFACLCLSGKADEAVYSRKQESSSSKQEVSSAQRLIPSRGETVLTEWEFRPGDDPEAADGWKKTDIPHDWAISGPFSRDNDLQTVAVRQNQETTASVKTGRTGGLPYVGKGTYRRSIEIRDTSARHFLLFDGAMSEAQVILNGEKVCFWPYGYNSFYCEISDDVKPGTNELAVLLENKPLSSRWYPGAGLYRKVRLVSLPKVNIPIWGTYITTPYAGKDYAVVKSVVTIDGAAEGEVFTVRTRIMDGRGKTVAERTDTRKYYAGEGFSQNLEVASPSLWSPESPELYIAESGIYKGGRIETEWSGRRKINVSHGDSLVDRAYTRFGIRSIEIRPEKGFYLNGERRQFRGVCLHHDLGPLGAAVNKAAIRKQLTMLKDMGCDAIRTAHNMPAEELVELCDEMGFMVMVEPFDEWDVAKCDNGYHRFFDEWAEKDMVNMIRHFRNNPSVVMWSIGNEVPSQWMEGGDKVAVWLQEICHREDPTRAVTCGMDQFDAVLGNGFASQLDVAGFNYKVARYDQAYKLLPQGLILGSETASTVSSRGVYHFPAAIGADILNEDHHSSSYDTEHCRWSNIPDEDLAADQDKEWVMGQFVWTGFDYLGEPSPYDTDAWPNHSSLFGIIDLASIPKDRYYLYRSVWNEDSPTLHILPHWNWDGRYGVEDRRGKVTPVYVYTSYPEAELFVNGVSQGRKAKTSCGSLGKDAMKRYRLMWDDVIYQPGEIKVVAFDADGRPAGEKVLKTTGKPKALCLETDRGMHSSEGEDLAYITVGVTDKEGLKVPVDNRLVRIKVSGAGKFKAVANGDPTCLEPFTEPQMHLFNGLMTVIVEAEKKGEILVEVSAKGVESASAVIRVE